MPFWIDTDDVRIDIGEQQLKVYVRNTFCFSRTYWMSRYSISLWYQGRDSIHECSALEVCVVVQSLCIRCSTKCACKCQLRSVWTSESEAAVIVCVLNCSEQQANNKVVDVEESMWALDEDWDGSTDATRSLMLSLARPALTVEEVTWKKGKEKADVLLLMLEERFVLFTLWHSKALWFVCQC